MVCSEQVTSVLDTRRHRTFGIPLFLSVGTYIAAGVVVIKMRVSTERDGPAATFVLSIGHGMKERNSYSYLFVTFHLTQQVDTKTICVYVCV